MKILLLILSVLIFTHFNVNCQTNSSSEKSSLPWFSCKKLSDDVLMITDRVLVNMYVVIGKDSALLIDTGHGVEDLKKYVESLVKLPVIVVNTHGHDDHSAGNDQYEKVYAHPDDFDLINRVDSPEEKAELLGYLRKNIPADEPMPYIPENSKQAKLIPIREGHIFDLGGKKIEVIGVPGHTKGSICLLDKSSGMLFVGDNNNGQIWLFLQMSTPLETYAESLENLMKRKNEFSLVLTGHGGPYDTEFLDESSICVKNILSGDCVGKDITTFAGSGKSCIYKRVNVIYNPENLHVKK